jgi:transposase
LTRFPPIQPVRFFWPRALTERSGLTSEEKAQLKALERENRELRQANEILKKASAYFAPPLGDCQAITCRAMGRSSTARSSDDWVY